MIKYIIIFFFVFSFLILVKLQWKFIFILPLFNLIADMSFTFFEGYSAPTFMRAGINLLFLFFTFGFAKMGNIRRSMYLFFFLIIVQLLLSHEFRYSSKTVTQVIISMAMLFAGYSVFLNHTGFDLLIANLKYIIYAAIIAALFGYLFNIGRWLEYTVEKSSGLTPENVGLLGSGGMYVPGVVIGLLPMILKLHKRKGEKIFIIGAAILLYIFILLNVRRTAILIPILGLLVFFYYTTPRFRLRIVTYLGIGFLILILSYPLYSGILNKRLEIRKERGRFEADFYKTENRYTDFEQMMQAIRSFDQPVKVIMGIGNNVFVDVNAYGDPSRRMIHPDIPKIFYSLGLLGLLLYFLIYLSILREIIKIPSIGELKDIKAGCFGLFIISVVVSVNGSITIFSFRTFIFLLLGAFLGYSQRLKSSYGKFPVDQRIQSASSVVK